MKAIPKAIFVVHCDPVGVRGPISFDYQWEALTDLIATADTYGAKISMHLTGSWACSAYKAGKAKVIKDWIREGHGVGTHPHPEYLKKGVWIRIHSWDSIPQEKAIAAMRDATNAVNRLVGASNNRVLDTLYPFYFSPSNFPTQFTHFAWGNNGANYPVCIFLEDGRKIIAVYYRTIPSSSEGAGSDPLNITISRMIEEYEGGGISYGPVLHPTNWAGFGRGRDVKKESIKWFQYLQENNRPCTRVQDITIPGEATPIETSVRVWTEFQDGNEKGKSVNIKIHNCSKIDLHNIKIAAYLPPVYTKLLKGSDVPSVSLADPKRPILMWTNQNIPRHSITTYSFTLLKTSPSRHPIAATLDVYVEDGGAEAQPQINRRWSMINLEGNIKDGWYHPFESVEGACGFKGYTELRKPRSRLDSCSADITKIQKEVKEKSTYRSSIKERSVYR